MKRLQLTSLIAAIVVLALQLIPAQVADARHHHYYRNGYVGYPYGYRHVYRYGYGHGYYRHRHYERAIGYNSYHHPYWR